MKWLGSILINSIILMVVAGYVDSFHLEGVSAALMASLILSFLNTFVKPLLILLTLPVTMFTLGLFLIVINAATLMLTSELMGDAFVIESFGTALLAALIISLLHLLFQNFFIEPILAKKRGAHRE